MNKHIVYFNAFDQKVFSKHIKFLERQDYYFHNIGSVDSLAVELEKTDPFVILVTDASNIKQISSVTDKPILAILNQFNPLSIFEQNKDVKNVLFVRAENDHLDTIKETINLIEQLC